MLSLEKNEMPVEKPDVYIRGATVIYVIKYQLHKGKGKFLYSAVSSPLDLSKRFTLILPWQTCSFRHQLGFSWKHSSHAAIAQRLFTHMSATVYSQVHIYTVESTKAS